MTARSMTKVGWVLTPAAAFSAFVWGAAQVDVRYVHAQEYRAHVSLDSVRRVQDSLTRAQILIKLDSANLRLTQIRCGKRVDEGCR